MTLQEELIVKKIGKNWEQFWSKLSYYSPAMIVLEVDFDGCKVYFPVPSGSRIEDRRALCEKLEDAYSIVVKKVIPDKYMPA